MTDPSFVYILRCADGRLYVGHTRDISARERSHNAGTAAAFTAERRPVRVVYFERYDSKLAAIRRERQIKGWSAVKKEALIQGDSGALARLSRRRVR